MTAPLEIVVIANCQSAGLGLALRLLVPSSNVRVVRIHLTKPTQRAQIRSTLDKADLIFTQDTRKFDVLNATELKAAYPEKCIIIPNIYFRGFHPDACYVGQLGNRVKSPIGEYHSAIVLASYLDGLSEQHCLDRISEEGFERFGISSALSQSLAEAEARDRRLDVAGLPILKTFLDRESVFMYTVNHPRAEVLTRIAKDALTVAELSFTDYDPVFGFDNLMEGPLLAVQPFVSQYLGYDAAFPRWRAAGEKSRFLSNALFIKGCYETYAEAMRGHLKVQSPPTLVNLMDHPGQN